jgi:hypothetical protein
MAILILHKLEMKMTKLTHKINGWIYLVLLSISREYQA